MNKIFMWIVVLASILLITGCGMSRLERDFGTSQKLARFNQTFNPDAEKNLEPVKGLGGQAAHIVIEKYNRDFEKVSAAPVYSINIGNMGNGK